MAYLSLRYEQLSIKAARHPSETEEYFVTRLLAYCLEYREGITFSKGGVSDLDDPPIMIKDLTGAWISWIEIGAPDAARLHKASKASPRVALYTHKEPRILMRGYDVRRRRPRGAGLPARRLGAVVQTLSRA